jgi:hypothetical protein
MKRAVSWLVWIVGVGLSVFAFAALGVREWPWREGLDRYWCELAGFALYGVVLLAACVVAFRSRKAAAILVLGSIIPIAVLFRLSASPYETFAQRLAIALIAATTLLIVGSFWASSAWRDWPELLRPLSRRRKALVYPVLIMVFSLLVVSMVIAISLRPNDASPDCGPIPVLWNAPSGSGVFTATVYMQGFGEKENGKSTWALVRIDKDFSDRPNWSGHVLIADNPFGFGPPGEQWFIAEGASACLQSICRFGRSVAAIEHVRFKTRVLTCES